MQDRLVQVIILVEDLGRGRAQMEASGLDVLDGGQHPGRGTANLIVAFGGQYLELLAVVDEAAARDSPQGRPVLAALSERGPGLARWSVETSDMQGSATRTGFPVEHRRRVRPDGVVVHWRCVAVDAAWHQPWRCAFMAWDDPVTHPARTTTSHPNGATGFSRLEVAVPGRAEALSWLGGTVPAGVVLRPGDVDVAGPCALTLASPTGPIPVG